jgi:hypothetical protein
MPTIPQHDQKEFANYGSILHPIAAADDQKNNDDKAAEIIQQYWRRYKITKIKGDIRKVFKEHIGIRESRLDNVSVLARLSLVKNLGTSLELDLMKKP